MVLYIENPGETMKKLLELSSEFSKVVGYKVNTQKSPAFLYTNNEESEIEIKELTLFTIATKRMKYLGINPSKETKELYTESYKKLINKRNKRWHTQRDRYIHYITKCNLQIQCNLCQIINDIYHRTKTKQKKNHNTYGKKKKIAINQDSVKKDK